MNCKEAGYIVLSDDYSFPIVPGENRNVLVVGTSGCGKSMSIVEPTLLANRGSMVIIDPKGNLQKKYADRFTDKGVPVYKVDLVEPNMSDIGFNPLVGTMTEMDIMNLANMIVYSDASLVNNNKVDPYWNQQSTELLSIILSLASIIETSKNRTPDLSCINSYLGKINFEGGISSEFERLIYSVPADSLANKMYKRFRHVFTAERTMACIYSSLESIVGKWSCREIEDFFKKTSFDITSLADKPSVVFLRISDSNSTFYPLATIMVNYWMERLFAYADSQKDGMCAIPVQFILDDYASNIVIEGFPRIISTCRARNIGMMVVIQSLSQLSYMHRENSKTIANNCEYSVFFGTTDLETSKDLSQRLDITLGEALSFPRTDVAVLRRGCKPVVSPRYRWK